MTVLGVTGHQEIPNGARLYVDQQLDALLDREPAPPSVCTSLARGADQIVGQRVLDRGGTIVAVVPCRHYRDTFKGDEAAGRRFDRLLGAAREVVELPYESPSEEAFWAAGQEVARRADLLIAIWDGRPSRGLGGTGDVVSYAAKRGTRTVVIWPAGVSR